MTKVIAIAPEKVNRRLVGIAFSEGRAEVDTDSAAYQFFKRRGFRFKPLAAAETVEESDGQESTADGDEQPDEESEEQADGESTGDDGDQVVEESDGKPERPHPVQGNMAAWFEYLTAIKPDHGFDLETAKRKDLIAAVNEIEGE